MSENVDLYEILGVSRTCSTEELKKSYKKLCIQHHPDKGGDENEFKKISEAYNILKDPEKKEIYDKFGFEGLKNGMSQNSADMQSMMENLFGFGFGGGRGQQSRIPAPTYIHLRLPLEDIVNGNPGFVFTLERKIIDRTKEKKECSLCQGKGFRLMNSQMGFMQMQQQVQCPQCKGARYENVDQLFQVIQEKINIPIPKNCMENHKFVLKNKQNERVEGGDSGDVVLVVEYAEHARFKRKEDDLYLEIPISFEESLTGFTKNLSWLDKSVLEVSYPSILKWNQMLSIPHKGLFNASKQCSGDLNLTFQINYPSVLDKTILEQLASHLDKNLSIQPSNMVPKNIELFSPTHAQEPPFQRTKSQESGRGGMPGIPGMGGMPFQMPGMGGGGPGKPPGAMECHQQ